ncbi:DUF4767 domain-containing protein [Lacticaseibacillus zeae]|uniref:DUF4767 domain-containing protein n=1 Tax=Lacticaseibacillus zeae TaxID=57037 RepID=UPI0024C45946|nr:DUF4767 domain-containing protein [Lacticaseibacillus zeae]
MASESSLVQQKSKSAKPKVTPWNVTKTKQLANFMHEWQTKMNQAYTGTYDNGKPTHYGAVFPEAFSNGELKGRVQWLGQSIDLAWSPKGDQLDAFQVVAVATSKTMFPTTYFFTLHDQRPVVFYTQTTNGDHLLVQDTQNVELQRGFAKIATGTTVVPRSDAELNTDVKQSVEANPQQIPKAYRRDWYYYSNYEHRPVKLPLTDGSGIKLAYYENATPKWLNVRGSTQTAGAGSDFYLRYKFYDGRQIPVMMLASGAAAWFDGNAYQTAALAQRFQEHRFGDEPKTREEDQ